YREQALVLADIVLEPRDALRERAVMGRLGDAEEVIVIAALLARILDHEGIIERVDRGQRDAANILIQAVFQRAEAASDLLLGPAGLGGRGGNMRGGAQ